MNLHSVKTDRRQARARAPPVWENSVRRAAADDKPGSASRPIRLPPPSITAHSTPDPFLNPR